MSLSEASGSSCTRWPCLAQVAWPPRCRKHSAGEWLLLGAIQETGGAAWPCLPWARRREVQAGPTACPSHVQGGGTN